MLKDGTTTKSSVGMVFERTFSMMPDLAEYKGVAGYSKNGAWRGGGHCITTLAFVGLCCFNSFAGRRALCYYNSLSLFQ
jgi:hypothetical protein